MHRTKRNDLAMSQNMTNEQFWDSVARSWAASFARIPTEYPALHARILEGRRKKAEAEAAAKGDSDYIVAGNPTEQALSPLVSSKPYTD